MTAIDDYIKDVFGSDANVVQVSELGHPTEELKGFGYGRPYQITFSLDGVLKSVVLLSMRREGGFGHDHFSDRAQILIWQHATFGSSLGMRSTSKRSARVLHRCLRILPTSPTLSIASRTF